MEHACHIPLAEPRPIYSVQAVERALEHPATTRNESLKSYYEKMREAGGTRYVLKPSSLAGIDALYECSPNFDEVIDDVKKYMALAIEGNEPIHFTPLLLLGDPGLGKTHFARSLAKALGTDFSFVAMNSLTAGWILSGASAQWSNAKPGKVAQSLVEGNVANPLFVLDEVDKAGGDHRYDPMSALYELLEKETAEQFKDEFVDIHMDASHILWIATANDERGIPEPIVNRMNVYVIERPDAEASRKIALAIYRDILARHNWSFPDRPDDAVLDLLTDVAPRDMRKVLLDAFGNAKLDRRDHLRPQDIDSRKLSAKKARVGFC